MQVVAQGNAHGGLLRTRLAQRGAGFEAHLGELALAVVAVKKVRQRVVGHIDVRPASIVEVGPHDPESVVAVRVVHAGGLGDVGERAIAIVVEQRIPGALQAARSAVNVDATVFAE